MKNLKYVDGFVLVVPKANLEAYKKMAEEGKEIWKRHGALDYKECLGNDLEPQQMEGMKTLSFLKLTNAGPDDTVWFSFIVYKSKEHRDQVNAAVMAEMSKLEHPPEMPFEMERMAVGGFEVVVDF